MKAKISFALLISLLLTAAFVSGCSTNRINRTPPPSQAEKMRWFNEAKFGLFIHWGLYAVPAGEHGTGKGYGEWIQYSVKMPNAEYEKYAAQFNPTNFNAKEWVSVAKNAGMKYLVITTKHHDGFCLFDSKLTDYDIVDATPYRRDPLKELSEECRRQGIVFCVYYSTWDWHHPEFPAQYSRDGFHGAPNPNADMDKYVSYLQGQLKELLTHYGPVGTVWFDDGGTFRRLTNGAALLHSREILEHVRQLQPWCIVNDRLRVPADYTTPEQKIPTNGLPGHWETCMTLNRHWGYNKSDHDWKSAATVISNLVDIASKGGNYLLNVGPTSDGIFPAPAVKILGEVGDWMKVNGEAIYGATRSPLLEQPRWGRVTQRGGKLYLHVFRWPEDGKLTVELASGRAVNAYLLANSQKLRVHSTPADGATVSSSITIELPRKPLDPVDTVIVLETAMSASPSTHGGLNL